MKPELRQRDWDELANQDPMWAVLSERDKRGQRWDPEEFFRTGERDVERLRGRLAQCGITSDLERVLDFGCGVGRLAQAFALHHPKVHGVDISGRMIQLARRHDRRGGAVEYHVNARYDLSLFPDSTFDLVHSAMVLQHMETTVALGYIAEFVRVARTGGIVAFQAPAGYSRTTKGRALALIPGWMRPQMHRLLRGDAIEMHPLAREQVEHRLAEAGAELLHAFVDQSAGPNYVSWFYFARRSR